MVVTDYILFCGDSAIPTKCIKIFPNDKPWTNGELKVALKKKKKKQAFQRGDSRQVKVMQKEIRQIVMKCKNNYKQKIERKIRENNLRQAWQGVYTMIGQEKKGTSLIGSLGDDLIFANELNGFYGRFHTSDF